MPDEEFLPLPYRRRSVPRGETNRYRIVTPDGKSVMSEGHTAAEAFKKSGVARAERIVLESPGHKAVIGKDEFPEEEAKEEGAAAPPAEKGDAAAEKSAADEPAKELGEDEVKKLLEDGKG